MAGIDDALEFLDPEYIDKAKEILSDPMGSGVGIVEAIKDFSPIEAADFVKDRVIDATFGEANIDDMIIGGGVGGGSTELPGILSKAGDYFLDQGGIPIDMSTLSNIGTAFTDQGAGGVIEVAKNQAVDLIKRGFVNEGIALANQANIPAAAILALANNPYTGPYIRGAGSDFADMGYDMSSLLGLGNIYDTGLNFFGVNRKRDEPVIVQPPIGGTNIPNVIPTGDDDNQKVLTGGTVDPSDDIIVTNLAPTFPTGGGQDASKPDFPIISGNQGGGQGGQPGGQPSTNPVQEANRIRNIMEAREQGANIGFNAGGLIQKYNHGGLHKNPHNDFKENPSIPDEIKDELMKYLLNKYMQEQELMKERGKDRYNQPPPTTLEAANGGLATIPRYLKGR